MPSSYSFILLNSTDHEWVDFSSKLTLKLLKSFWTKQRRTCRYLKGESPQKPSFILRNQHSHSWGFLLTVYHTVCIKGGSPENRQSLQLCTLEKKTWGFTLPRKGRESREPEEHLKVCSCALRALPEFPSMINSSATGLWPCLPLEAII